MKQLEIDLQNLIRDHGFTHTAEIGVLSGKMSDRILHNCSDIIKHICVDPWKCYNTIGQENSDDKRLLAYTQEYWDEIYQKACNGLKKYGDRVKIIRATSVEGAKQIEDNSLDCVIIDSDHSYRPFLQDAYAWLPKIRNNGLWVNHDYNKGGWRAVYDATNDVFGEDNVIRINSYYATIDITNENKEIYLNKAKELLKNEI